MRFYAKLSRVPHCHRCTAILIWVAYASVVLKLFGYLEFESDGLSRLSVFSRQFPFHLGAKAVLGMSPALCNQSHN